MNPLNYAKLNAALMQIPRTGRWWIAYSGGLDSHCLLHILANRSAELPLLTAVHVDHGLNPQSKKWASHCASTCAQLGISYQIAQIKIDVQSGESREAAARAARYSSFAQFLAPGDVLITAHHQNDQAETLLLQLLRGAGVCGLSAMASLMLFHKGYLARPLLNFSRAELCAYAQLVGLTWIEDDSNSDISYDRNYLRRRIIPLLLERWPSANSTIARAAHHQAEAAILLENYAQQDLAMVQGIELHTVRVAGLLSLRAERARNVIRYWIRSRGYLLPSAAIIEQILQIAAARWDSTPLLCWEGCELRRYRDLIYLMAPLSPPPHKDFCAEWHNINFPLQLPWGVLSARYIENEQGISTKNCAAGFTVRFRRGGEKCHRAQDVYQRPLKNLWQQLGVPHWERIRTPLLFIGRELAAIPGVGVCHQFQNSSGEPAWKIDWQSEEKSSKLVSYQLRNS